MDTRIKIGYLLSYDYRYILTSLKEVYEHADIIVISYDIDLKTWTGNSFELPEQIFVEIKLLDVDNKIQFYSDSFYVPNNPPLESETRQRNMLAKYLGTGGWHIQVDSDEYLYNFSKLSTFLRKNNHLLKNPSRTPITFRVKLIVLFKKTSEGFYVINPYNELCNLITNSPNYSKARATLNQKVYTLDYYVIHQSWARDSEEIQQKIGNWGHVNDFDTKLFYESWNNLNSENYKGYLDFHPLPDCSWLKLDYIKAKNIDEFILSMNHTVPQPTLKLPISLFKRSKLYLKSLT